MSRVWKAHYCRHYRHQSRSWAYRTSTYETEQEGRSDASFQRATVITGLLPSTFQDRKYLVSSDFVPSLELTRCLTQHALYSKDIAAGPKYTVSPALLYNAEDCNAALLIFIFNLPRPLLCPAFAIATVVFYLCLLLDAYYAYERKRLWPASLRCACNSRPHSNFLPYLYIIFSSMHLSRFMSIVLVMKRCC